MLLLQVCMPPHCFRYVSVWDCVCVCICTFFSIHMFVFSIEIQCMYTIYMYVCKPYMHVCVFALFLTLCAGVGAVLSPPQNTQSDEKNELLFGTFHTNYNDLPPMHRKGSVLIRQEAMCTHTHTHSRTHTHIQIRTHTPAHTRRHTQAQTNTHVQHTYTRTLVWGILSPLPHPLSVSPLPLSYPLSLSVSLFLSLFLSLSLSLSLSLCVCVCGVLKSEWCLTTRLSRV